MTRDEAIAKVDIIYDPSKLTNPPTIIVDALSSLGLLKLDEPIPEPIFRAYEAVYEAAPLLSFPIFRAMIDSAGLKIVEK